MEALILGVATTLFTTMATDGWATARSAIAALWERAHPNQASAIEKDLDDLNADVSERGRAAEDEVTAAVKSKLRRLLKAQPHLQAEVQRVLDEQLLPLLPQEDRQRVSQLITQTATVSGHGVSNQAGGNIIQVGER